ncbi:CLUMA_CG012106, isoform A [Clunio marinus]|uniref:CLUMA_CG012106, isoform A n=1 Tax=Clunio marinus TaxID=568069 RepID=A0A1J1IEE2_9DIPT|nr:CLUMA_CG012106, isoform A [Clunio marinus]
MIALEFKTLFVGEKIKATTNWKTDTGWQNEEVIDSDWIDSKGIVRLTLTFESTSVLITDIGSSLITKFPLNFELERVSRLQLWGNIKELQEISLKFNQRVKRRRSPRKKSK